MTFATNKYSYAEITATALAQVANYLHASPKCSDTEARWRQEVANGIHMGWRALVEAYPDEVAYRRDDQCFKDLLGHGAS